MNLRNLLPPTYLYVALALMVLIHFLLPVATVVPVPWNFLGFVPLLIGLLLNLFADKTFKKFKTTVKPFEISATLVTSGVFRFSRNPMYLGFVLGLTGLAIWLGSVTPYAIIIVFFILMDRRFIRVEEEMLAAQFGSSWLQYKQHVRRWL